MKKYEIRAMAEVTLDFIIYAEDEADAKESARDYTEYVDGGKIKAEDGLFRQNIRMELPGDDELTHCFFMEVDLPDVNEIEEVELKEE